MFQINAQMSDIISIQYVPSNLKSLASSGKHMTLANVSQLKYS